MEEHKHLAPPFALGTASLELISEHLRQKVFEICRAARSGHIGGSSGAVELMATLYFGGILRYSVASPRHQLRDRVLVRGHLGPIRYPIFGLLGWIEESELLGYRSYGSRLHGHEDHAAVPGVDLTPSGSLGMLLSYGVGSALSARHRGEEYLTYVFIGDGEEEEGNIAEAARHAAHLKLSNLIAIIDRNGKQLSDPMEETDSASLETMWYGYGWNIIQLSDGHDVNSIREAYLAAGDASRKNGKPSVIMAKTLKGAGLDGAAEHFSGYHTTSTCKPDVVDAAINGLVERDAIRRRTIEELKQSAEILRAASPSERDSAPIFHETSLDIRMNDSTPNHPDFCQGEYFKQLKEASLAGALSGNRIYFLTADVTRQDQVAQLGLREFCHYYNTGIREQHTLALAHGISLTDPSARIVINSFDAFMYRWMDQVNAAVQGGSSMLIIADTSGITNAQNGKTHQSSGQPGAVLSMPGIAFLEPWDAEDTFRCLNWAIGKSRGVVYLRVHSSPVTLAPGQGTIRNMSSYVVYEPSVPPQIVVVASGLTVSSALESASDFEREGVGVRVVNLINHKEPGPVFCQAVESGKPLLTVYNGTANVMHGNIASHLLNNRSARRPSCIKGLGFDFGTTGKVDDLKRHVGIDANGVHRAIRELLE